MQESAARIEAVVDAMIMRCDEIADCASDPGCRLCNLLLRGDSTALALAKIAHHMALPLRQIFLLCSQKLHEQLTVGC